MGLASGVSPPLWTMAGWLEGRSVGGAKVGRFQLPCFAGSHYLTVLGGVTDCRIKKDTEYSSIEYVQVGHIAVCERHAHTRLHPIDTWLATS